MKLHSCIRVVLVLICTVLGTAFTSAKANDEETTILKVFEEKNFQKLCVGSDFNVSENATQVQIAEHYLNAAKVPYSKLLSESLLPDLPDEAGTYDTQNAKTVSNNPKTFMDYVKSSIAAMSSQTEQPYQAKTPSELQTKLRKKIKKLDKPDEFGKQITLIKLSFHLWALEQLYEDSYPYKLELVKNHSRFALTKYLIEHSSTDILKTLLETKPELVVKCKQTFADSAELSPRFKIRKNADSLEYGVNNSKAEAAEISYTRLERKLLNEDRERIGREVSTSWSVEATIGYAPFEHKNWANTYLYTSVKYEDTDEEEFRDDPTNCPEPDEGEELVESTDVCHLLNDGDATKTITFGAITELAKVNLPFKGSKIKGNFFSVQDLAENSELYTAKISINMFNDEKKSLIGKGLRLFKGVYLSTQPKAWVEATYVADFGKNEVLQQRLSVDGNKDETDGRFLGVGWGLKALLKWQSVTLYGSYNDLSVFGEKGNLSIDKNSTDIYAAGLDYSFPGIRNMSIALSYEKGNNLESFNEVDDLKLKLKFKY